MGRTPTKDPRVGTRIGIPLSVLERIRRISLRNNSTIGTVTNSHFDKTLALLLCEYDEMPKMYVMDGELIFNELLSIAQRCQSITKSDQRFKKAIVISVIGKEVVIDGTSGSATTTPSNTGKPGNIPDPGGETGPA